MCEFRIYLSWPWTYHCFHWQGSHQCTIPKEVGVWVLPGSLCCQQCCGVGLLYCRSFPNQLRLIFSVVYYVQWVVSVLHFAVHVCKKSVAFLNACFSCSPHTYLWFSNFIFFLMIWLEKLTFLLIFAIADIFPFYFLVLLQPFTCLRRLVFQGKIVIFTVMVCKAWQINNGISVCALPYKCWISIIWN